MPYPWELLVLWVGVSSTSQLPRTQARGRPRRSPHPLFAPAPQCLFSNSPMRPQVPLPLGQEDGLDPGSASWPLLGNWLPATSSPCVSPFPLNASQLPRWCPDNPHPLPGVRSSFRGSAHLLESFSVGRIMSPSVITHLPGN